MIRVLLVDGHLAFRQPLAFLLGYEPDLAVVGQAGSLAEARPLLAGGGVDVALVDPDLPDGNGAELVGELRAANPRAGVVILAAGAEGAAAAPDAAAGAGTVLPTSCTVAEIVAALRRLGTGEPLPSPTEAAAPPHAGQHRGLDRGGRYARQTGGAGLPLRCLEAPERARVAALTITRL